MAKGFIFFVLSLLVTQAFGQVSPMPAATRDSNAVKQLFFAGLREKLAENYNVAATNFSKIVGIDPSNDAAYFELANANLRMVKLPEAELNIKRAIFLRNNNQWYWRLLGEVYKRGDKMPELVGVLEQLIKLNPNEDNFYFDKANAQFLSNQPEAAKKTYNEIETKFGNSEELSKARQRFQRDNTTSDSELLKLLESNQGDVKDYLYAAGLLFQKENDTEGLKILLKAQQMAPKNYQVNLALANVYYGQNKEDLAFSFFKLAFESDEMPAISKVKVIISLFPKLNQPVVAKNVTDLCKILAEKNPDDAQALAIYGDVLYQQNKLKEALVQYQTSLRLKDQIYVVWEQVVNIQTLLGNYEDAIKVGDEALSIYPNQASLFYYMAYALFKKGKYDDAQINLKSALQLDVENKRFRAQVYALQGDIYINQNNFSLAKAAFEKAIAADSDNYLIMNNYAYYLALRNDDLTQAALYAEKAANAMPNNPSITDTYAYILFKQQKYDLAKFWIEKTLQNNSDKNSVYLERYGDILFMKGDKERAVSQWQKAKDTGNGSDLLNKKINEKKYFK